MMTVQSQNPAGLRTQSSHLSHLSQRLELKKHTVTFWQKHLFELPLADIKGEGLMSYTGHLQPPGCAD